MDIFIVSITILPVGCTLEDGELFQGQLRYLRNNLDCCGTGPNDSDALAVKVPFARPPRRMVGFTLEVVYARNVW
jgi:hypothetical protein